MKNPEEEKYIYFDISKKERDSAIRFLLGTIIQSRNEDGFPSNCYTYDEDVNVYLAHLLFAISLPEYHEMAEPYLSRDSNEVMRWVNETEDQTIRYFIFKVNADHILVHTAIFDDLLQKKSNKFFKHSKRYYQELARLYYEQAAAYHKRIYRKKTGVGDVLDKIAYYFENYQKLLKEVRTNYFHFLNSYRDQAFTGFMDDVSEYEKDNLMQAKLDEFLDVYGRWLNTKDKALEDKIIGIIFELKGIDPDFQCDALKQFDLSGGSSSEKKCA